jgi:hypothetical protein
MSLIETRGPQLFPVLDAGQIETAKRFASGPARHFAPGEVVFGVGQRQAPAWLVLRGSIEVARRDGLNREAAIPAMASANSRARSASSPDGNRLRLAALGRKAAPRSRSTRRTCVP